MHLRRTAGRAGKETNRGAWWVWGLAASFYLVALFHRMSLGVASLDAQRALPSRARHDRHPVGAAAGALPADDDPRRAGGRPHRAAQGAGARAGRDGHRRDRLRPGHLGADRPRRAGPGRRGRRLHVPVGAAHRPELVPGPPVRLPRLAHRSRRRDRPDRHHGPARPVAGRGRLDGHLRHQRRADRRARDRLPARDPRPSRRGGGSGRRGQPGPRRDPRAPCARPGRARRRATPSGRTSA